MNGSAAKEFTGKQRTFLGHPIGLYVLFFTEMWERFSYYGMRALLILYMVNYFRWSQKDASTYYKVYTSFVYVTPIIGGFLADRYLGNRNAVIIGAILMAIGQFLLVNEARNIFIAALIFLIIGNGFFKPNMATQVGRLYPTNDGRRDGAYTIFYMGINLGAFLAPLACGWLKDNTVGGYHSGFVMAGIGMIIGLVTYLLGQPFIREIPTEAAIAPSKTPASPGTSPAPSSEGDTGIKALGPEAVKKKPASAVTTSVQAEPPPTPTAGGALTEAEAEGTPSILGSLAALVPMLLCVVGVGIIAFLAPYLWFTKQLDQWDALVLATCGICLLIFGYVCSQAQGAMRDRVLAILVLGVFVMFFWAAAEQAGNVLNIWADKNTNRYITNPNVPTPEKPEVIEDVKRAADGSEAAPARMTLWERYTTMFNWKPTTSPQATQSWGQWFSGFFNPITTTAFQSVNSLGIIIFAPLFAWLWVSLDKRKLQPSIPIKMAIGLIIMTFAMAVMYGAASAEDQKSTLTYDSGRLPEGVELNDKDQLCFKKEGILQPFHAGRLTFDPATRTFALYGVLPDLERNHLVEETAPEDYRKAVEKLKKESAAIDEKNIDSVEVQLIEAPPGFDFSYAGIKKSVVRYRAESKSLVAYQPLAEKEVKGLLVAGGDPTFRAAMTKLMQESTRYQVSSWWLFWSYVLTALGELCLSPVGLSMVSKLAPARFGTMLMGMWYLTTSALGNFVAGALGEIWGIVPPNDFFLYTTMVIGAAALVLLVISRKVTATMHGVE